MYHKAKMAGKIILVVSVCIIFSVFNLPYLKVTSQTAASEFLEISGKNIIYKGQNITLRGANFANISALLGTNIGGIGSGRIEDIEVREEDYKAAREVWGMNHIRFGMSYSWWTNDTTANKSNFFAVMDQHVAWAKKYGMWITLLQFTLPGDCYEGYNEDCFSFWDSQSQRDELKNFWVQMAQHYVNESAVSFDLINEPVGSPSTGWSDAWTKVLAQEYINAVRTVNTKVPLFITANSDATFSRTYTGGNLIYEVHFYEPMEITHNYDDESSSYPGTYCNEWKAGCITWDRTMMDDYLKLYISVDWANSKNVPLYIGEWGSLSSTNVDYITYLGDLAHNISLLGLNHAYYSFKAGNSWGMYKKGWPLVERESAKNAAIKKAFEGNIYMNSTTQTIPTAVCGNGSLESGEICDDGNLSNNDQCSSTCQNSCNISQYWNGTSCTNTQSQSPYGGEVPNIPTKIEAEDFDEGGQGESYNDSTPDLNESISAGEGSNYRSTGVDIKLSPANRSVIGYGVLGEWLEYTVNVPQSGKYYLNVNGGSIFESKTLTFSFNGNIIAVAQMPQMQNWDSHSSVSTTSFDLQAGPGVVKVIWDSSDIDLDWFEFVNARVKPMVCKADYNTNGTVDLEDFGVFAQYFKKDGLSCDLDLEGNDCYMGPGDFQTFATNYKVKDLCL